MRAKVLLIGGTGAMGFYLRRELVSLGYEVYVTSRKERPAELGVRYIVGNGKDFSFIQKIISTVVPDVVVDFMIYSTNEFAERYSFFLERLKQYVFISSYRVFNETALLREDSPRLLDSIEDAAYLRTDEYALSKARCENMLRNSGRQNWTILRPSITYSSERFQFGCLEANVVCYRSLRGLPVIIPNDMLAKRTTMTWSGDVAKMISRLILKEAAFAEDFNVVTSESRTWGEVAEVYRNVIGMEVKRVSLAEYLGICGEYQVRYDRMFNRVMDNSKVLKATNLHQEDFKSIEHGLKDELSANIELLQHIRPNIVQNAKIDKICGIINCPDSTIIDKLQYFQFRFPNVGVVPRLLAALLRRMNKR